MGDIMGRKAHAAKDREEEWKFEEAEPPDQECQVIKKQFALKIGERTLDLQKKARSAQNEWDLLTTVIDSMSDGVWVVDAKGNVMLKNTAAKEQTLEVGLDPDNPFGAELLSQVEVFTQEGETLGMEMLARLLRGESVPPMEIGVRNRRGGETFFRRISANGVTDREKRVVGAVVVVQDITSRKRAEEEKARLEEQLRQAQKMEAIGTLAGGVAHHFNNVLQVIIGNAELALDDVDRSAASGQNLEHIMKASERARDLVKQILAFSRKTERGRYPLKLAPIAKEICKLLRAALPSTIRMDLDIQTESDTVLADPPQIGQVLMNLATNAAYAMRKKGGILRISLSNVDIRENGLKPDIEMAPGSYVKVSVQDTGTGMTDKVRRRIFEPFFTTKGVGLGTGMGLAVVYGIVKSHKGAITFDTEPDKGTTFNVFLPLVKTRVTQERDFIGLAGVPNERYSDKK